MVIRLLLTALFCLGLIGPVVAQQSAHPPAMPPVKPPQARPKQAPPTQAGPTQVKPTQSKPAQSEAPQAESASPKAPPSQQPQPSPSPSPQAETTAPAPQPAAPTCAARLAALGLETRAAPVNASQNAACSITEPVILVSVLVAETVTAQKIGFPDGPLLSCAMAEAFGTYARDIAFPLAKGIYDQPLAAIATGPGFECRTRNHVPGAKVSSHGQGNAIDIASILLHDGTRIAVEHPQNERGKRLITGLRAAGCGAFSTALGPGSDAAHATHLHFDIEARGRDGKSKFCQ